MLGNKLFTKQVSGQRTFTSSRVANSYLRRSLLNVNLLQMKRLLSYWVNRNATKTVPCTSRMYSKINWLKLKTSLINTRLVFSGTNACLERKIWKMIPTAAHCRVTVRRVLSSKSTKNIFWRLWGIKLPTTQFRTELNKSKIVSMPQKYSQSRSTSSRKTSNLNLSKRFKQQIKSRIQH